MSLHIRDAISKSLSQRLSPHGYADSGYVLRVPGTETSLYRASQGHPSPSSMSISSSNSSSSSSSIIFITVVVIVIIVIASHRIAQHRPASPSIAQHRPASPSIAQSSSSLCRSSNNHPIPSHPFSVHPFARPSNQPSTCSPAHPSIHPIFVFRFVPRDLSHTNSPGCMPRTVNHRSASMSDMCGVILGMHTSPTHTGLIIWDP
ncbi:hypothetical protein F4678DRAFT_457115 [Xylaria arbuscula]|nr:hypothetical protein F4678DRAFT_457115 [Xylaria arbuscula]